jgi:hypothetical protein
MKADLQRKKQIYQRNIRSQQINEYFTSRRQEVKQSEDDERVVYGRVQTLLD